ncbi:YoaK family protein [soil metagenome]
MPTHYLAKLTSPKRTARSNLHLGATLAVIAGALNAGGFLAIGQYTSHMTGIISSASDYLILGKFVPAFAAIFMLIAFTWGAACTALIVNYAKRNNMRYIYTPVLWLEAGLLLVFGLVGSQLREHEVITVSFTAILLCYVMGLQNALITKISNAVIRTTHVTGLVTDLGIELGKMIYWNRTQTHANENNVAANHYKLHLYSTLIGAFFIGGLLGAAGFKYLGFISTLPLAAALILLSIAPRFSD